MCILLFGALLIQDPESIIDTKFPFAFNAWHILNKVTSAVNQRILNNRSVFMNKLSNSRNSISKSNSPVEKTGQKNKLPKRLLTKSEGDLLKGRERRIRD